MPVENLSYLKIKKMVEDGLTDKEIANHFSVSQPKISSFRKNNGIIRLHKNEEWLKQKYCIEKNTIEKISKMAGVGREEVRKMLRKLNIPTDYEIVRKSSKKHDYNENIFNKIDIEEKAYWLGFIMGDGQIEIFKRKRSDGSYYENFRLNMNIKYSDVEHLNKFLKFLTCTTKKPKKTTVKMPSGNIAEVAYLRISSYVLANDLMSHGVKPNKSLKEEIPTGIPNQFIKDFFRGIFDADGHIPKTKRASVSICDGKRILKWIQSFYPFLKLRKYKNSELHYLASTKQKDSLQFLDSLYENSNIYLDRKYDRYKNLKLMIESNLCRDTK